ncbi:MAG: YjbE family putative metal transport protein [Burkholderiales bacterium]|jgi:YjbE family integral membrane protein|nr:YjbE family putative metal transport protein [Burkholderiales bacterium]
MSFTSPDFWVALLQIIGINIVLSGDNAVVIALAARSLPAAQQRRAVAWGSGAAVVMRIVLTIVAVEVLRLPYLKLVGAGLLLWIAVQLLLPEHESGEGGVAATSNLASAIRTILVADLVMSLDNVIGVAAAAKDSITLLVTGLAVSIPIVVFASTLLLTLMSRFPVIITIGAALLGWVAGEMAVSDPALKDWVEVHAAYLHYVAPGLGAIGVVLVGKWLAARAQAAEAATRPVAPARVSKGLKRVLLAVDGSESAARAVQQMLALRRELREPTKLEVQVLNVQRPVTGDVSSFVAGSTLEDYYRDNADQVLAPVRAALSAAGVAFKAEYRVGEPGETIAQEAQERRCDLIVMGTRGMGASAGALLGSVAQAAAAASSVPVLLVT